MNARTKFSGLFAAALLMAAPATGLAAAGPRQVIHDASEQVRGILKVKVAKGSKAEQAQKEKLKKVVDGFLDYTELAKRALGPHWKARTPEEQTEFVGLLRELIEASYEGAIRKNADYTLDIEDQELDESSGKARIFAVASAKNKKGKLVSEDLTFHLYLKDRAWMIWDVEFGDVSLVRHYRGEFNRKIKKESYAALLKVMREKLADIKAGKKVEKKVKL